MGEWRTTTLGQACDFLAGSVFPNKFQGEASGDYPFIKVSDMNLPGNERYVETANHWISQDTQKKLRARVHPAGAIAFAKIGVALTYNRRRILRLPTIMDNNMMSAVPHPEAIDSTFFFYLMRILDFNEMVRGTALPYLNISDLKRINVQIPPLPTQRVIAHILGTLDDLIDLNRRMNETLEQIARTLFNHYFPYSSDDELPEGWRLGRLEDEFDVTMGQSPLGETYNEKSDGFPFFQGRTDFGFRFPTPRVFCTAPTRFAKAGDTLVSVRAPVGSMNMSVEECSIGRGVAAVRHKMGSRSYTYYLMRSLEPVFERFEAEGTVFGSINKVAFNGITCVIPPEQLVEAFERIAFPMDGIIESNEIQSRTLVAIRDALLPKLMAGEIRVMETEKSVGGHV